MTEKPKFAKSVAVHTSQTTGLFDIELSCLKEVNSDESSGSLDLHDLEETHSFQISLREAALLELHLRQALREALYGSSGSNEDRLF